MSVVKKAVQEAKDVARLSVDAAKRELIEQMSPTIQKIINKELRAGTLGEDLDRIRRHEDGYGDDFEEGKEMGKDTMENISSMFPGVNEVAEEDMEEGYEVDEELEESADEDADDIDEEFELSEQELESVYAEALQLEVDVTKGFRDMEKPHEFGAGAKAQYQSDPNNLADYKNGEYEWDNVEPPAKKDWTVKEIRSLVKRGIAENKKLTKENRDLVEMVKKLHGKLKEMNLLNAKILHVNKFISANKLTNEQKKSVIESIDSGKTVSEVKNIFGVLQRSYAAAGAISESKGRGSRADNQKARTTGGMNPKVLRESAGRSEGGNQYSRWNELAGLKKLTNG